MKPVRSILFIVGFMACAVGGFAADPNSPVDSRLNVTYQRLRFSQQFPPEAVQFIQEKLQDVQHPLEVMAQIAQDKRPEVRSLLAMLVGEYGETDGAKILWTMTRDELESVRLTAAGALAHLGHLTQIPIDVQGLEDERPAVRRLTATTLAAIGNKAAEESLIETLKDSNELVRTDAVKALAKASCGTGKGLGPLVEMLHDPSVMVRDRTAQVLGGYHENGVVEPLTAALKDPDWHVRASAADSLASWVKTSPLLIEALIKVLENDDFALVRDRAADSLASVADDDKVAAALVKALGAPQRDVRFHAAQAIVASKAAATLPMLMTLWRTATPEVREKIMEIFGRLGGPDQLPLIIEGTNDSDPQVQLAAVNALRSLKDRGGSAQLLLRLQDPNPHIRAAATRAIGDLGDKENATKIMPLLRDQSGYVRSAAAEALGKLGDSSAILPLIQILSGEKPTDDGKAGLIIGSKAGYLADMELTVTQTKTRAIQALGDLRSPDAVEPIINNGLKADDAGLRAVSAYALGQIRDPRAVGPLQDAVRSYYETAPKDLDYVIDAGGAKVPDEARRSKEKESRVRASVAWALGQIGDAGAKETLLKAMNDQNSLVRDSAVEALARIQEKQEQEKLISTENALKTETPKSH